MENNNKSLILFYHEESPACQKLKNVLPKDKNIQFANVANIQVLPKEITSIPALIVDNKEVLLGKKVFDYFSKSDDMEYLNFGGKNSTLSFGFSTIGDEDNVESGSGFSSINAPDMSNGVPEWNDESNDSKVLDIDRLQSERDELMRAVAPKQQ